MFTNAHRQLETVLSKSLAGPSHICLYSTQRFRPPRGSRSESPWSSSRGTSEDRERPFSRRFSPNPTRFSRGNPEEAQSSRSGSFPFRSTTRQTSTREASEYRERSLERPGPYVSPRQFPRSPPGERYSSGFDSSTRPQSKVYKPPKSSAEKWRERHDPEVAEEQAPHLLAAKVTKLCAEGGFDQAVRAVRTAPKITVTTPVWNTLLWECMKSKRFQTGYDLYTDMKRRGYSPNARTYQSLLNGLSKIENWAHYPKQLKNAHSLFERFKEYIASVKRHGATGEELTQGPVLAYIKILGENGLQDKAFEVYNALDKDGPLAPDNFVFSAMFNALSTKSPTSPQTKEQLESNASGAKLLWTQMNRLLQKSSAYFRVDSFVVSAAIAALSRGRPADQDFAFQIAREYYGFTIAPTDLPLPSKISLEQRGLAAILALCNYSEQYATSFHIWDQVLRRRKEDGDIEILDRRHMDEVLLARSSTDGAKPALALLEWAMKESALNRRVALRPIKQNFDGVILIAWRTVDWSVATRALDLMTGYSCQDFADGRVERKPQRAPRSPGLSFLADTETMSAILNVALATGKDAHIRQALRLAIFFGEQEAYEAQSYKRGTRSESFFRRKFTRALGNALASLQSKRDAVQLTQPEMVQVRKLMERFNDGSSSGVNELIETVDVPKQGSKRVSAYEKSLAWQ